VTHVGGQLGIKDVKREEIALHLTARHQPVSTKFSFKGNYRNLLKSMWRFTSTFIATEPKCKMCKKTPFVWHLLDFQDKIHMVWLQDYKIQ